MHLKSFHFYNSHFKKLFHTDLHLFELSVWIQAFAQSLISVFIPIILWKIGLSIKEIILFYIIFNAFDVPLNFLAKKMIMRYGARVVIIWAIFADLLYLIILYNLHNSWLFIGFLALTMAIFDAFYWVAHLYIFVQSAHATQRIRNDVSMLNIVRSIGGLFAPAIGAYILIATDYRGLIFFSTLMMFLSLIPLFKMRHLVFKPEAAPEPAGKFFAHPLEKINFTFQALNAFQSEAEDVIWPFFIFFLFNSIRQAALIPIIISFAGLIVTYITGKYSLKENIYKLVALGALLLGLTWFFRIFFLSNAAFLFVTVFLIGVTRIFSEVPLDVAIFERAKKTDVLNAATYRNAVHMFTRGLLYVCLFFVANFFKGAIYAAIISMFVLGFASFLVSLRERRLEKLGLQAIEPDIDKD
jgi:MFS family permease